MIFIEYLSRIKDINKNFDEHIPGERSKLLMTFEGIIADILKHEYNKKHE